jgi:uncharacterized protein (DUF4415 family)
MGENELYPLEKRTEKNEECTMNISKKRLSEIAAIKDSDIDYSDILELDDTFWANAELKMPQTKDKITVRIDHDIVEWLKSHGTGYQSKMNSILRQFMLAKQQQK